MGLQHGNILPVLLLCAAAGMTTSCIFSPEQESSDDPKSGLSLAWSDEFDSGSVPSSANWVKEVAKKGAVNNEVQAYVDNDETAYVSDGTLKIKAVKDSSGSWTSARLKTYGLHYWTYGYMEARIKMPSGNGVWPAFWMMPENSSYGSWPRSGELDIMEYSPSTTAGRTYATVHHSKSSASDGTDSYSSLGTKTFDDATTAFHTYGLKWTDSYVEAFYDGTSLGTKYYNDGNGKINWPYDKNFYIILNLAMGGTLGGSIDSSLTSATYEVDYVRVYQ
jgi:Beta-glucanase/Beta-glucan synthetase